MSNKAAEWNDALDRLADSVNDLGELSVRQLLSAVLALEIIQRNQRKALGLDLETVFEKLMSSEAK